MSSSAIVVDDVVAVGDGHDVLNPHDWLMRLFTVQKSVKINLDSKWSHFWQGDIRILRIICMKKIMVN